MRKATFSPTLALILVLTATFPSYARGKFNVVNNDVSQVFTRTVLLSDISNPDKPLIAEIKRDGTIV